MSRNSATYAFATSGAYLPVPGTIFVLEPNEVADPIFHEDCQVLCVKVPSIKGDKYEVF